jgi:phage portal protein BeeE
MTPNEARRSENLPPVTGGDELYLQQQNYSLGALARRDASEDPFGKGSRHRNSNQIKVKESRYLMHSNQR